MEELEQNILRAKLELQNQKEFEEMEEKFDALAPKWYSFFVSYLPSVGALMILYISGNIKSIDSLVVVLMIIIGSIIGDNYRKHVETNKRMDVLKKHILKLQRKDA